MAATKTSRTIQASATNTAAGSTNGTEVDLSTKYGMLICGKITNGATGPTIPCDMVVYVGEATTVKREFSRQTAGTANNGVYEFIVEVPPATMFVNVTFIGNTAQNVTIECVGEELTTI